jgi:hypothetical protein
MIDLISVFITLPAFCVIGFYFFWMIYGTALHLFWRMRDEGPHETGSGVVGVMGRVPGTGAPVRKVGGVLFGENGGPK